MAKTFLKTTTREKSSLGQVLEVLATELAEQLINESSVAIRLEGLKVLSNYYALTAKIDPPFKDGVAFDEYRKRLAESSGRGRSGSGGEDAVTGMAPDLSGVLTELGISAAAARAGIGDEDGDGGEDDPSGDGEE